ncbi:sensor histidine kinase [Pseudovibrio brasiliensis]|uniref:histidine kinase n=1 Tax=Pseudovibrio brasiliensis TaxID=1898042 RepID=A0ABX8ASE4_9HYPH|nr:HAMP domain-containing sensor histidine kinase [Pseudovibrio brasiliensis]QUS56586.1 HAMP domain-containing histidine kinase [Pseudovibrio brasiliensis]
MKYSHSLELKLIIRLSAVLVLSIFVMVIWLWIHLFIMHDPAQTSTHQRAFLEFFSNVGWVIPAMMLTSLGVIALTLRRSLLPLRQISSLAAQIRPKSLHQRLPTADLPSEISPLVGAINNMLSSIEEGFIEQRHFTENVAHELRTPLQVLGAGLEELEQTPRILILRADLERMARSVDQILAISRLETRFQEHQVYTELNEVAVSVLSYIAPLATRKNVSVSLEKSSEPVIVHGEQALISDLLRNLVENALAVSHSNAGICVHVKANGSLEVVDQGPGIPNHYKDKVFQRFWRLPESTTRGTGLGLAIVKDITTRCGAEISILDNLSGGSVFHVDFVLKQKGFSS